LKFDQAPTDALQATVTAQLRDFITGYDVAEDRIDIRAQSGLSGLDPERQRARARLMRFVAGPFQIEQRGFIINAPS